MGKRSSRFWTTLSWIVNPTSALNWIVLAAGSATKDEEKTWRARGEPLQWAWWTLLILGGALATCMQLEWIPFAVIFGPLLFAFVAFFLCIIWAVILVITWRPPSTLSVAGYLWWTYGLSFWLVAAFWRFLISSYA